MSDLRRKLKPSKSAAAQEGPAGGRKPDAFYRVAVGAALLHLADRAALECSPLAQLPGVVRLADGRYPGKIWRRGLCLRDLLTQAVVNRAAGGDTLTAIARDLGLWRESLSLRYGAH